MAQNEPYTRSIFRKVLKVWSQRGWYCTSSFLSCLGFWGVLSSSGTRALCDFGSSSLSAGHELGITSSETRTILHQVSNLLVKKLTCYSALFSFPTPELAPFVLKLRKIVSHFWHDTTGFCFLWPRCAPSQRAMFLSHLTYPCFVHAHLPKQYFLHVQWSRPRLRAMTTFYPTLHSSSKQRLPGTSPMGMVQETACETFLCRLPLTVGASCELGIVSFIVLSSEFWFKNKDV